MDNFLVFFTQRRVAAPVNLSKGVTAPLLRDTMHIRLLMILLLCSACADYDLEGEPSYAVLGVADATPGHVHRYGSNPIRTFPDTALPLRIFQLHGDTPITVETAVSAAPDIASVSHIDGDTIWMDVHKTGDVEVEVTGSPVGRSIIRFQSRTLADQFIHPVQRARFGTGGPAVLLAGSTTQLVPRFRGRGGNRLTGLYDDIWTYEGPGLLSDPTGTDVAVYTAPDEDARVSFHTADAYRSYDVVTADEIVEIRPLLANKGRSPFPPGLGLPGRKFRSIQGFVAMHTETHEVYGVTQESITITATGADVERDPARPRHFKLINISAETVTIELEWNGLVSTGQFEF